jgi:rubrerythrin
MKKMTNHLRVLAGIGKTSENLQAAMNGENFEVEEMYPAFIQVAQGQNEKQAEMFFKAAMEAEKVQREIHYFLMDKLTLPCSLRGEGRGGARLILRVEVCREFRL